MKTSAPDGFLPLSPQVFAILLALASGEKHGYAIMRSVEEQSDGSMVLGPGTLYGSLKRLLGQGLVRETGPARSRARRRAPPLLRAHRPRPPRDRGRRGAARAASRGGAARRRAGHGVRNCAAPPGALAVALYRLAVACYPPLFRRRFGDEMVLLFRDRLRAVARAGAAAQLGLLWSIVADVAVSLACEHFAAAFGTVPRARRSAAVAGGTALAALALGTLVCAYVLTDALLLRPMPYPGADRLLRIATLSRGATNVLNAKAYQRLGRAAGAFASYGGWDARLAREPLADGGPGHGRAGLRRSVRDARRARAGRAAAARRRGVRRRGRARRGAVALALRCGSGRRRPHAAGRPHPAPRAGCAGRRLHAA